MVLTRTVRWLSKLNSTHHTCPPLQNEAQLEALGNYSMIVFGWQALLRYSNWTGELSLLVTQAQIVKRRHPNSAVIV